MADPVYPKFNEAHPPLMENAEKFPPPRSGYDSIGTMRINGADMNRVTDSLYDWRPYLGSHELAYRKKVAAIIGRRNAEIDHYLTTRRRYWELDARYYYPVDTEIQITKHAGMIHHTSHTVDHSKTTTERLSIDLGIDSSPGGADVPGEIPEIPPVVPLLSSGAGGASTDFQFSRDMTETLHITDTDDVTYQEDTTSTVMQKFQGATHYIRWEIREECILERVRKGQTNPDPEPVSRVVARTNIDYWDSFPRRLASEPRGRDER